MKKLRWNNQQILNWGCWKMGMKWLYIASQFVFCIWTKPDVIRDTHHRGLSWLLMLAIFIHALCIGPWWSHRMEAFSALLALCAGNSPVTGGFPSQRPVTRGFDVFLICAWISSRVNKREARNLRRHRAHYDLTVMTMMHPLLAGSYFAVSVHLWPGGRHILWTLGKCRTGRSFAGKFSKFIVFGFVRG